MHQLPLDLIAPPAPTLDNFAQGANAEVLAVLHSWLSGGLDEACLYLWGPSGAGKSHLLQAAVAHALSRGLSARYLASGTGFAAAGVEVLAIDDIDSLAGPDQAALFTLLNAAAGGELRLLLAGSNAPAGLPLRSDVRTRVAAALVLQVRALSDTEKVDALRRHAQGRGFELTVEGAEYLLRHGRRDLPALMRVLDAADRYSLQTKRAVTVPLLREVLQGTRTGGASPEA